MSTVISGIIYMIKGHWPDELVLLFCCSYLSSKCIFKFRLSFTLKTVTGTNFSMIHRYLWQKAQAFFHLKKHLILPTTHLRISAGGSDCWPSQPGDYLGNISQKIVKNLPVIHNIFFFPPLPVTSKVVQLLPTVSDGHHELCLRLFCVHLGHTGYQICFGYIRATSHYRNGYTNVL